MTEFMNEFMNEVMKRAADEAEKNAKELESTLEKLFKEIEPQERRKQLMLANTEYLISNGFTLEQASAIMCVFNFCKFKVGDLEF